MALFDVVSGLYSDYWKHFRSGRGPNVQKTGWASKVVSGGVIAKIKLCLRPMSESFFECCWFSGVCFKHYVLLSSDDNSHRFG